MWSGRLWVQALLPTKILWPFFFEILAVMLIMSNPYYVLVCKYHCNVADLNWWFLLYLNFRSIALRLAAILKKVHPGFESRARVSASNLCALYLFLLQTGLFYANSYKINQIGKKPKGSRLSTFKEISRFLWLRLQFKVWVKLLMATLWSRSDAGDSG